MEVNLALTILCLHMALMDIVVVHMVPQAIHHLPHHPHTVQLNPLALSRRNGAPEGSL